MITQLFFSLTYFTTAKATACDLDSTTYLGAVLKVGGLLIEDLLCVIEKLQHGNHDSDWALQFSPKCSLVYT